MRTLYVHSNTLDFILRKDADPGALFRAQQGDIMGKGLVIAALMRRAYGKNWTNEKDMDKMTPAVTPEAMKRMGKFAVDFEEYEKISGSRDRILHKGYWIAP
ncbi:MAG: hypothetical protein V2I97_07645 [Desulfococcaceae bacterium]|jgi:hypothetical protein|nr:hypothetical protein [Desulfococcaceae bacterium]